jgi:hypothetical protein
LAYKSDAARKFLAGAMNFDVEEIEVFRVKWILKFRLK